MQEFLADFFYRHPVELEDVTNGELLGTILDASLKSLSFQQPGFVHPDLQAPKHTSFQLPLPEYAWPADILFQINKPNLMYAAGEVILGVRLPSHETAAASHRVSPQQGLRKKLLLPFFLQVLSSTLNMSFFSNVHVNLTVPHLSAALSRSSLKSIASA